LEPSKLENGIALAWRKTSRLHHPVIRAARAAADKNLQVMVDYNQSLTVPEAIGRVQLLEEEALVWVEEPTRADDFAGHARIATGVPHSDSDW
jgi:L-alanine-DL-glutamate epimerase-like enolase superfamily enzyme